MEAPMTEFIPLQSRLADLAEDVTFHAMNLMQGVCDLACIAALVGLVYASGVQAPVVVLAPVQTAVMVCTDPAECITATPLEPM
jgi:hypothetical protein